jgi:hypothetical protein
VCGAERPVDDRIHYADVAADFSDFATLPADQAHTIAAPGVCINSTFIE